MVANKVIDIRVRPPTRTCMNRYLNPPDHLKGGYTEVFKSIGLTEEDLLMDLDDFTEKLDEAGIEKAVISAADVETTYGGKVPNEHIAEIVSNYPDKFIGFAGVDPHKGMEAIREFEQAVKELGLKGLNLGCWELQIRSNNRKYYPLYAKAIELDVPVTLHTSINYSPENTMDYGRPIYLDEVASDFPELKIIACHGGWPWVLEMVGVARRHENVYIELSGHRPKYFAAENSGWGPLMRFGRSLLKNQVLFGTDWPLLPFERSIQEMRELPLKEEVIQKWLYDNAAELLKL